ncbi:MAG: hypothetical protein AAF543_09130 [Pseudomonadota bacterium]
MRALSLALACCTVLASLTIASPPKADTIKVTPELTVLTKVHTKPADGGPLVLRGSAERRGLVDGRYGRPLVPNRFQLGAGAKLWMTDPVDGRVLVCDERRTSRVGSRFIGCLEGQLPYAGFE